MKIFEVSSNSKQHETSWVLCCAFKIYLQFSLRIVLSPQTELLKASKGYPVLGSEYTEGTSRGFVILENHLKDVWVLNLLHLPTEVQCFFSEPCFPSQSVLESVWLNDALVQWSDLLYFFLRSKYALKSLIKQYVIVKREDVIMRYIQWRHWHYLIRWSS